MKRFYCNCCGCDFDEIEGKDYVVMSGADAEIVCPVCGAYYDEDDEDVIESYQE